MTNLEKSELVIAKILGLLMEWGISDELLDFSQLGLEEEYLPFYIPCVKWLQAEGILRANEVYEVMNGNGRVLAPTLTAHGLSLMGRSLAVGEATTTIGEAVKKTSKKTEYYTGAGDFTGGFIGGLLKSLGSN